MTCRYCSHEMTLHMDGNRWDCVGCSWTLVTPLHAFPTVEAQP